MCRMCWTAGRSPGSRFRAQAVLDRVAETDGLHTPVLRPAADEMTTRAPRPPTRPIISTADILWPSLAARIVARTVAVPVSSFLSMRTRCVGVAEVPPAHAHGAFV